MRREQFLDLLVSPGKKWWRGRRTVPLYNHVTLFWSLD
jgi:hypothetical protein